MLLRIIAAVFFTLVTCTAHAQFGNIFGNSRSSRQPAVDDGPPPPTPEALSRAMAKLREYGANVDRACAEGFAVRFGKGLPELVGSIRSPDDGMLQQLKLDCAPRQPHEGRLAQPLNGDEIIARLVDWVRSSVLSRREFETAFAGCRTVVSDYQDFLLTHLNDRIESARSRTAQQELTAKVQVLRANRELDAKIACVKQLFAELRFANSGSMEDQLSGLNGHLDYTRDDVPLKAKMLFEDLTPLAQREIVVGLSLSKVDRRNLTAVINVGAGRSSPHPLALTACLLPFRWVDWFRSQGQCHGSLLEAALYKTVPRL